MPHPPNEPEQDLTPPTVSFYLLQLNPGQFPAAQAALASAGIRLHLYNEVMLGDNTETHASLYAAEYIILPELDEHLADDGLKVTADISDDDLRQVAQWCANRLSWYENHEVYTEDFQTAFPHLIVPATEEPAQ